MTYKDVMNDPLNDPLFKRFQSVSEKYAKDHELDSIVAETIEIEVDFIIDSLKTLISQDLKNTYSIDKHIVNNIDFIIGRMSLMKIKVNRSDIINKLLEICRINFKDGKNKLQIDLVNYDTGKFNSEYFENFLKLQRKEKMSEEESDFTNLYEKGKKSISISLNKKNSEFITKLAKISTQYKPSKIINALLNAILLKVDVM